MIDFSEVKTIAVAEGNVAKIVCAGMMLWQAETLKNWAQYSVESDGKTIYNGGLGHKMGYRIRSGGAEAENENTVCTGYIPLKQGDTLRISPAFSGENVTNAINFADGSFGNLGQITDSGTGYGICNGKERIYKTEIIDGISVLTLTDDHDASIKYVRITHYLQNGADLLITVNQKIV
jgi:hypothetical protein